MITASNLPGNITGDVAVTDISTSILYDSCSGLVLSNGILDRISELYCLDNQAKIEEHFCQSGCLDGKCLKESEIPNTCIDTDGSKNFNSKGKAYGTIGTSDIETDVIPRWHEDYCIGSKSVYDFTCKSYTDANYTGIALWADIYECPDSCSNGACVKEVVREAKFKSAQWECYDGTREERDADNIVFFDNGPCMSLEFWQTESREFCEGKCSEENGKCGVNSFSVSEECSSDNEEPPTEVPPTEVSCSSSECLLDNKCYTLGYRKSGDYCSDGNQFVSQLETDASCNNNFECSSNLCVNSQCVSGVLWQKILDWFKNLFG